MKRRIAHLFFFMSASEILEAPSVCVPLMQRHDILGSSDRLPDLIKVGGIGSQIAQGSCVQDRRSVVERSHSSSGIGGCKTASLVMMTIRMYT